MSKKVWFWQRIVSPHMAGLVAGLAERGFDVTYVAEQAMSSHRSAEGWQAANVGGARLLYAPSALAAAELAQSAPPDSLHICQGIRGNGSISSAQKVLAARRLKQWVIMETVEDGGWRGFARRMEYRRLIASRRKYVSGYLAIGHDTSTWLLRRGAPEAYVFPFAYFLNDVHKIQSLSRPLLGNFRIMFVGRFIELKRLELLIRTVAALGRDDVELHVIGSGPLEERLRSLGKELLGPKLHWVGLIRSSQIPNLMSEADLLVLPSRYDGWGAVVSEAIMVGTPAVCSDRCGAAEVVRASGQGGVFPSNKPGVLFGLLQDLISKGRPSEDDRTKLARWGRRLGACAGADYLSAILASTEVGGARPMPPWTMPEKDFS